MFKSDYSQEPITVLQKNKAVSPEKITKYTYFGKPIILQKRQGKPPHLNWKRGYYMKEELEHAAVIYLATGDYKVAASLSKVPEHQIRSATKTDWFREVAAQFREENKAQLDAKFSAIIDTALGELAERLANGDHVYNARADKLVRKPVGAKELAIITAVNVDKRQLMRGEATSISQSNSTPKLEQLAERFERLANIRRPIQVEGVVKDITDAIEVEETGPDNGGSGPQPEVCEKGGDSYESGEGIQPSGPEEKEEVNGP